MNHGLVDIFSLVHGTVGVVLGAAGLGLAPALIIATGWEILEHLLKNLCPAAFVRPSQDTLQNAASDVLFIMMGWWAGRVRLRRLVT